MKHIDDINQYVDELLKNGAKILKAVKIAPVEIWEASQPFELTTISNGKVETVRNIKQGEHIAVSLDENCKRFSETDENYNIYGPIDAQLNKYKKITPNTAKEPEALEQYEGVCTFYGFFQPVSDVREVIETTEDIEFVPPNWGTLENLPSGGFLNITDRSDIYGVEKGIFNNTHKIL